MMFTFLATVKYKMTIGEGLCSTADFLWAKQRWWWWWWNIWMFHFLVSRFKILHRGSVLLSYCLLPNSPRSTHSRKSENIQTQTGNFPCNFGLITQINKRTVNQHLSVWKNLQHSLRLLPCRCSPTHGECARAGRGCACAWCRALQTGRRCRRLRARRHLTPLLGLLGQCYWCY